MSHIAATLPDTGRSEALREHVLRLGVWMFLATVTMLFAAFSSAYLIRGSSPDWEPVALPWVVWFNTAVLAGSTLTVEAARRSARRGRGSVRDVGFWTPVSLLLGAAFLAGQLAAWRELRQAGHLLSESAHSAFIYVLTGAHALHLAAALVVLALAALGAARDRDTITTRTRRLVDLGGVFWHFLTGLWIYVLILLTVFGGEGV